MAEFTSKISHDLIAKTGKSPSLISGMTPENYDMETSKIVFLSDGDEVSRFVFNQTDDFTLEERPSPVSGSRISTSDVIKDMNEWLLYIKLYKQSLPKNESDFKTEIEKNEDGEKLEYRFTLGNDLLLDAIFNRESNVMDFGPRVEVTIPMADFSNYLNAFNDLMFVKIPNALIL